MSIRMIAPTTKAITPPTPNTPKLGVNASVASRAMPTRISASPAVVDGQHLQREGAEQQADDPGDGADTDARAVELQNEPVEPDHQQDQGHVRVGDDAEQLVAPIRFDELDPGVGDLDGDIEAARVHCAPVDGFKQRRQILRDDVDDVLGEGFGGRDVDALAHRGFGPLGVAPRAARQAP